MGLKFARAPNVGFSGKRLLGGRHRFLHIEYRLVAYHTEPPLVPFLVNHRARVSGFGQNVT